MSRLAKSLETAKDLSYASLARELGCTPDDVRCFVSGMTGLAAELNIPPMFRTGHSERRQQMYAADKGDAARKRLVSMINALRSYANHEHMSVSAR